MEDEVSDKPKPVAIPDIKVLAAHFTAHNFLPMFFHVNLPKIESAMGVCSQRDRAVLRRPA